MIEFKKERVENLRSLEGLSLRQFGKRIGMSGTLVHAWEDGICKPRVESLVRICNEFNVPLEYFFAQNNVSVHGEK